MMRNLLGALFTIVAVGCGGSTRESSNGSASGGTVSGDAAVPSSGGSSAAFTGTTMMAASGGVGSMLSSGGTNSDTSIGTGVPTPGVVTCGGITCPATPQPQKNTSTESYCCFSGSITCQRNANLGACESGIPAYCDDTSDCDAGLVCCEGELRVLFSCQTSCGGRKQLCKTDGECLDGKLCRGTYGGTGWSESYCL